MKKNVSALLCLLLAMALLLTGCAGSPSAQTTVVGTAPPVVNVEPVEITILGFQTPRQEVVDNINDVLNSRGFPATVKVVPVNYQNLSTSISSFESLLPTADLALFGNRSILQTIYDKGLLTDMAPYMEQVPMLSAQTDETVMRVSMYDGEMIGYPLSSDIRPLAMASSVLLRGDILNELGVDVPKSVDELLEICILARDAGLPCELTVSTWPPYAFHRTYGQWPFYCDYDSMAVLWPDGTAEPYAGSDIFYRDMEILTGFAQEGVLNALYNSAEIEAYRQEWDGLAAIYPLYFTGDCPYAEDIVMVQFEPEAGNMSFSPAASRYIALSAKSENPELAMQLLELIYTDQEVYYSFVYGVEGKDWEYNDEGYADASNYGVYAFNNYYWDRHLSGEESILDMHFDEDTLLDFNPPAFDYVLDTDLLRRIYTSQAYTNSISGYLPMRDGLVDSSSLPDALRILEAAGINEIVEAYESQYAAYMGLN